MINALRCAAVVCGICSWQAATAADKPSLDIAALRQALTFYSSFNSGTTAEIGEGDLQLFTAPSLGERAQGQSGLPAGGSVSIAENAGRFGHALRIKRPDPQVVFYKLERNLAYADSDWSGAISIWLKLDPDKDLAPGYVDPLFVTPRTYDDAALWIDFTDKSPRQFRHGAVADRQVWDPRGRGFGQTPADELPVVVAAQPPFSNEHWTHVVISFSNFNTGRPDGVSTLYVNGKAAGHVGPREQTLTWDITRASACLGISYTGLVDELAFFNRALSDEEVRVLFAHPLPLCDTALRNSAL